jgi:hypothetical protein
MLRYARIRGLKRSLFLLPGIPLWFMAFGVGMMTPVPYPIAYALIGGLSADSIVKHPQALEIFPEVKLIDFDSATKDALEKTHPSHIERVWDDGKLETKSIKHEGCFIDHREVTVNAEPEKVFDTVKNVADHPNWLMEANQAQLRIVVCVKKQSVGDQWIEWRVIPSHAASVTYLSQTVFFSPRGLPGFLYRYLLNPFHLINFRGLIKSIARQSEKQ